MLNYIWLALITLGILTAFTADIIDISNNKYNNGKPLYVTVKFDENDFNIKSINSKLEINSKVFNDFYKTDYKNNVEQEIKLSKTQNPEIFNVYFKVNDNSPEIWKKIANASGKEDDITGKLFIKGEIDSLHYHAMLYLEEISFLKIKDVTNAIIEYAGNAVKIAIGLIGIMSLWLGIMKIAEKSGMINLIAKFVKPVTKFLFPDVPPEHPAIASIVMNISANMLGLGNAATPFGLKAMEELDKLNTNKGTATNAMCTFLAINTAGLTLIPATAIAIRAAAGSSNPTIIIGTSFFGALCATITGIIAVKILEKYPFRLNELMYYIKKSYKKILILVIGFLFLITILKQKVISDMFYLDADLLRNIIQVISIIAIPLIIFLFVIYGVIKKVKIYEEFVDGAKEGFNIGVKIIPYLVAMLMAIGIFRAGGGMDILVLILSPITNLIGFPAEAIPMALMRPLSGSGALGIMSEIISKHGPDSFIGILVSTIMGSTETTFYVLALYFGSVNIRKTRHAVAAGVLADIAGITGAFLIVKFLFG
ncbi:nucleoside recognition domain-containing protein [Rosettibacter firmus]|uniref:nucleoside recognition domain-containing protein n=1 Tax=Rosettibacter firmus TaxID=3111522 RepID=UPI00336BB955